jgi:hypothetical protein
LVKDPYLEEQLAEPIFFEKLSSDEALVDVDGFLPIMQQHLQQVEHLHYAIPVVSTLFTLIHHLP